MQRALSAPGKLFLSGEYAVLWGGTARIAAVGPRTQAFVRRRADREIHLVLADGRLVGHATSVGVNWRQQVPETFYFAARTIDEALRAHGTESLGFELAIAPSPTSPEGRKLGMGGSALAAVLTSEACRFVLEERYDALKLALLAHGKAQGNKGSGGDVAAIFAGGVVRYRRYDVAALTQASDQGTLGAALAKSPAVDLWRLPAPKVHLGYAFARESASTRLLIAEVESRLGEGGRQEFVRRTDALGDLMEDGILRGDFPAISAAAEGLETLLAALGPLETPSMRQILALAKSAGCAGKMSGAGGGDGCILFAQDAQSLDDALASLTARGFLAFELTVEPGLRGEATADPKLQQWLDAG